jgi:hypothetical protein
MTLCTLIVTDFDCIIGIHFKSYDKGNVVSA